MKPRLTRVAPLADLEVRTSARTIVGLAVPYDRPANIADRHGGYVEIFAPGSFARTIRERGDRVKLMTAHDYGRLPIGRASKLSETRDGLVAELRVSKTTAGDEALELVRDGAVDSLSIGFRPVRDGTGPAGEVVRLEARLDEISLVFEGAYSEAKVLAVRATRNTPVSILRAQLDELTRNPKDYR